MTLPDGRDPDGIVIFFIIMPRELKRFGCDFKCGQKAVASKKKIVEHESKCFKNPENKTCLTCENEVVENTSSGLHIRSCMHPVGERILEINQEDLRSKLGWVKPYQKCAYWNVEVNEEILNRYQ